MQKAREKIRPPKGGQNLVKVLAICHLRYYTGTDSEYRSKRQSLNKDITTLQNEIAALEGTSSAAGRARLEELKAQLSKKQDELDRLNTLYDNKKSIERYEDSIEFLENDRKSDLAAAQKKHKEKIEEINALY